MSAQLEFAVTGLGTPRRSALRRLWQCLPQARRRQILFDVSRVIAPLPDAHPHGGFPLGIAGLYSTLSGIGEGARLGYAALEAAGYAPCAFDLSPAFGQVEFADAAARRVLTPGGGTLIVHHNGPFMPHALWALGRARIRARRIIGYWAWELPRLPAEWQPSFRYVHEIWVPSGFTRDAIAAATKKPVHVVPHPLPPMTVTPDMRGKLGLPPDALVVLNVVHLGSAFARKNPLAAIAAFRRAFGDAPDRLLVIKLIAGGATQWAQRALDDAIAGSNNIRLIDGMLPEADMLGLMAASDIVISLHRSEGFGLVPAQAMRLGKPVIATAWSGNLEFMNEHNSALVDYKLVPVDDPEGTFGADGQRWAEADVEHAATWLTRLADDASLRAGLGAAAAADIGTQLSSRHFANSRRCPDQARGAAVMSQKIAINGRFLTQRSSGVQRFAAETIKAIDALLDTDYAALKGHVELVAPRQARDFPLKNIPLRRAGLSSGYFWEQIEFPLHAAGELLLNLCMLGPLATRHQIVVVHDATVQALPDNFSPRFRAAYKFLIPRLCKRAALTVTVSEFSRREIGKWYGADVGAMPVCYEGGDHIKAVAADPSVIERLGLTGRRFFLGVGVDSANKNIKTVVEAFHRARFNDAALVLTGAKDTRVFGDIDLAESAGVHLVGFVSDSELRALYEQALALVFPSYYEGFGLPPLEAMTCGCPVIISEQPALMEVCDHAVLHCDADDTDAIMLDMQALGSDADLRARLAAAGRERAQRFTWAATARSLLDHCQRLNAERAA